MTQCKIGLFDNCEGFCPSGADFSNDGRYRYRLWRKWEKEGKSIMFIGLNPSTANQETNDPTIRRLISFAKAYGFTGISMYNLFALVSAYPEALKTDPFPIQEERTSNNDNFLLNGFETHETIVTCWGSWKLEAIKLRAEHVIKELLTDYWNDKQVMCFGKNKDGQPKHPLYLSGNTKLESI